MTEELLALQAIDTTADQLEHRRSHLPELAAAVTARAQRAAWERRRDEIRHRIDELTAAIEAAEHDSRDIDRHRDRLNAQLRTVIAPREAEVLQREIQTLSGRRSEVDDRELLALEQQAALDDDRSAHLGSEEIVNAELHAAEAALSGASDAIDSELVALDEQRSALRAALAPQVLTRYDRLRAQLGVAVARLVGSRCDGCHLDLSAAEAEAARAVDPAELADCPQCGRLLVR